MNATLLFDVDGTLIDSYPGIRHGFLIGLEAIRWDKPDEEFIRRIPGPPMPETMRSLGMSAAQVETAMRAYSDYMSGEGWQRFEVYPGMAALVERLAGEGYRVCTATSKSERFARAALERAGLLEHIDFLGAASNDGKRAKKVDVIRHVLDQANPERPLMVGDRLHDFEGAKEFGIPSVAMTWGYGAAEEWDLADWVARDADELERIIREF
ncbi:HAD-IA family hydrolase [Corynebacterium sp. zg912]|uniref:HAD-IA family hydrolase n=1 Tax=Corynebacterium wankanglinii TaxID=2735136 RepID=A0A7H0K986_9CORY|nr:MULTISPECIES: HAD-IA family hydrolase [Corynebacterium]MBA1837322.1 HAD-IA family hydrolase [Corynebacterium wankanglinii]MCR5928296.1 HAD-IA family hydrolase [Corynebacterium sp. zg912]QNP93852.1 HAD-IA family hydrolase [Corynebacterium wankanglinii]